MPLSSDLEKLLQVEVKRSLKLFQREVKKKKKIIIQTMHEKYI